MDETVEEVENKPAITPEEFTELRSLQAQQTFLQAQGYQIFNFISNLDSQYEDIKNQINNQLEEVENNYNSRSAQAREQLVSLETELANLTDKFRTRFQEIVSSYGFENVESVAIADTEPHYLTPVNVEQPAQPTE